MITTYLQGGMGNQMFQYATALAAAKRLGTDLELNTRSFVGDPMRQYSLGLWAGIAEPLSSEAPRDPIIREEGLPFNPSVVASVSEDCTLWGYFQCARYFEDIRDELESRFVPKQPLTPRGLALEKLIKDVGDQSIFLTIRRTDYTKSDFHGVLPIDYYLQALEIIAAKAEPAVFVFSDEPEWCKANLKLPYQFIVAGNYDRTTADHLGREDEELWLMRQCKHAIMANSSYSWWGAWLGADKNGGTVIAPKRWFLNAPEDSSDICPKRWIQL